MRPWAGNPWGVEGKGDAPSRDAIIVNLLAARCAPLTSCRYAVDAEIGWALWLKSNMTDRQWDAFYPFTARMAIRRAAGKK